MIKRFFVALTSIFFLSSFFVILPVRANTEVVRFLPITLTQQTKALDEDAFVGSFRSFVAFVAEVDADDKTIKIRKDTSRFTVDASNAMVVKVTTADGAKVVALSDLQLDTKAYFLGWNQRGPDGEIRATLIVQNVRVRGVAPKPALRFAAAASSSFEGTTTVSIPVRLSRSISQAVTAQYTVSGTATGGGVDHNLANGTLTIPAGHTTANIIFSLTNDTLDELNETMVIRLSNAVNATLIGPNIHTFTIKDNDQPRVQFSGASSFSSEITAAVNIPVTLSVASSHQVKIKYKVTGGSATGGGVDFSLPQGELTFAVGKTTKNITLTLTNDTSAEADETIVITLFDASGASLGSFPVHTFSIRDDDGIL